LENNMLVLVATRDTQGDVDGDYCCAVEGELVTPIAVECCVSDSCGCARGFPGLVSAMATTTAMVVDRTAIAPSLLRQSVIDSLERDGWTRALDGDEFDHAIEDHLEIIRGICAAFGEGKVVRRDGPAFWADIRRCAA
jgi:hypothetical protein